MTYPRPYFLAQSHELLSTHERWRVQAKLLGLSKGARHRLEVVIWHRKHEAHVSLTARHFGLARKTVYTYLARCDPRNLRGLEERSRAPHRRRTPQVTPLEEQRVMTLRGRYPTAGRDKLVVLYEEDFDEPVRPWVVRRVVRDRHLYAARALRRLTPRKRAQGRVLRKKRVTELLRQPHFGFLMEADTIVRYWNQEKRYILTATDTHAHVSFARMYPSKATKHAADFLRRLVLLCGGRLHNLHVDNGSEFQGEFQREARHLGLSLYHARPYRAKDKPVIERFNGVLQQEFVDLGHFTTDVDAFNADLTDYLVYYNTKRPHHSLGLRRPLEVAMLSQQQPTGRVLPMYAPMTGS